jgi:hypothetical protein
MIQSPTQNTGRVRVCHVCNAKFDSLTAFEHHLIGVHGVFGDLRWEQNDRILYGF